MRTRITKVTSKNRGRRVWRIVLLVDDDAIASAKMQSGHVDVKEFGEILKSGWGEDAPEEIWEAVLQ